MDVRCPSGGRNVVSTDSSTSPTDYTAQIFEQNMYALLEAVTSGKELAPGQGEHQKQRTIARAEWHFLLSDVYRPLGIDLKARQNADELLCRCLINSETLGKALELMVQFLANTSPTQLVLHHNDEITFFCLNRNFNSDSIDLLDLVSYWRLLSWLIDEQISLHQVAIPGFDGLVPLATDLATKIFRSPILAGQSALVSFDTAWLHRPILRTYNELRSILLLPSLALIPWESAASLKSQVYKLIEKSIAGHGFILSFNEAAQLLGRSPSTLRRQLLREEISFQQIKNDWRRQQSEEFLRTTKFSLDKIAAMVGYESTSVFSRAFKSWTGRAPTAYRMDRQVALPVG